MTCDKRLIEDYLPIEAISEEASGEPRTKGHISTLHIWRARRPLVACRAAVYAALVPATRFVPNGASDERKKSLGRANASKFVKGLAQYPGPAATIEEASQHIIAAHASQLGAEVGKDVTVEDITEGKLARPRVLDMFAGGGAIPLEAARLGCEAHAVELNPVAHIIELCTARYPQEFGPSMADDVEKWGRKVLEATKNQVKDLYATASRAPSRKAKQVQLGVADSGRKRESSVVAYYWTRTAPCPNPACHATVPLYRQTWLRNKDSGFVALKPVPDLKLKKVHFSVVESKTATGLGFDPSEGSESSATVCPFCQTALTGEYIRHFGDTEGYGQQLMCVVALNPSGTGKLYFTDSSLEEEENSRQQIAELRAKTLEEELGNSSLDETIPPTGNAGLATGKSYLYGIRTFRQMFAPRQRCTLLTMAREIRRAYAAMIEDGMPAERAKAVTTYLGLWLSRLTDRFNTLARWNNARETIESLTSMKRFAMMWDFPEVNIFGGSTGDALGNLEYITAVIRHEGQWKRACSCLRASALELPYSDEFFDAVITDPPYYDNESYSELSDVCYVWMRPSIGFLYPDDFASRLTPKKKECVAAAYRQGGKAAAKKFYEESLLQALKEANRTLKKNGILVLVYAHKTTMGWSTLVDAIRRAEFEVSEAWPMETEAKGRVAHQGDAALASSIFLVARKRRANEVGSYEGNVREFLSSIVRERVAALWDMGISGADLVIASVGAGLQAFTRHSRVEYDNGEEVPAERFLSEVETVVLETILSRLSKEVGTRGTGTSLAGLDAATRFYTLWRYTYGTVELDAGEAIIFANGTHVELDGQHGLTAGAHSLVEKKKDKYRLLDFEERGSDEHLGLPRDNGQLSPVIDVLHRLLWLMEHKPPRISEFLKDANANLEQVRLLAQALAGPALKGGELKDVSPTVEQVALGKILTNWQTISEGKTAARDRISGQQSLQIGRS